MKADAPTTSHGKRLALTRKLRLSKSCKIHEKEIVPLFLTRSHKFLSQKPLVNIIAHFYHTENIFHNLT